MLCYRKHGTQLELGVILKDLYPKIRDIKKIVSLTNNKRVGGLVTKTDNKGKGVKMMFT